MSSEGDPLDFRMDVRAHATAFVAPGAVVVGEVTLGARASVWFGAVVRGDLAPVEVGDESNVQDNAVLHVDRGFPVRVGRRVVIGHGAVVHGADVEDGTLIGMGSIVLTGSRVGAGSLIAAGALVGERQRIPPGSLVTGVPGKIIGPVSEGMRAAIARGADHYVALSRAYQARGIAASLPPVASGLPAPVPAAPGGPEVDRLLEALAAAPREMAGFLAGLDDRQWSTAGPGDGPSCERIVAEWLRDEEDLWAPRLERLLADAASRSPRASRAGSTAAAGAARAAERLTRTRAHLLGKLRLLAAAEREDHGEASGSAALGELVRGWAAGDASHLRRLAAARGRPGT